LFPFLIGRIRTKLGFEYCKANSRRFPFLIGRIRTDKNAIAKTIIKFPFLIGRIRTYASLGTVGKRF